MLEHICMGDIYYTYMITYIYIYVNVCWNIYVWVTYITYDNIQVEIYAIYVHIFYIHVHICLVYATYKCVPYGEKGPISTPHIKLQCDKKLMDK